MSKSTRGLIATVAGFAALGFGLLSLFYWAAVLNPPFSFSNIDGTLKVLAIATIVCIAIYLLANPESVGATMGRNSTRLTANALIAAIVAVGIGVVVNIIVDNVPAVRADWTAGHNFAISPQTIKILQDLDTNNKNVTAVGFFINQNPTAAEDLMKEYHAYSSHFRYEFVDPNTAPLRARELGVTTDGTIVFTDGTKRESTNTVSEREFTSALARLLQTGVKKVAFLTGHGERAIDGTDQRAYSQANAALKLDNYTTVKWSLTTSPTLAVNDVTVLVVAAPTTALGTKDVQTIQSYLDAGGHVFILLDPEMKPEVISSLTPILTKYGLTPHNGIAVDLSKSLSAQDPSFFGVDSYPSSPITIDLGKTGAFTAFAAAMAISPPTSTLTTTLVTTLVQTSGAPPVSWLESLPANLQYDPATEIAGPISIGVSVEPPDDSATSTNITDTQQVKTRLVVFGDADFPSDLFLSQSSQTYLATNADLFANAVSWLAGQSELVSIRAKDPSTPPTLTLDTGQKNLQLITSVFGLPLFVLLLGGAVWWRRK